MALPQQLKSSPTRAQGTDLGSTVPSTLAALESVLCDIFGFTPNVDITASPFSFDNAGEITKQLVLQKAAGPVGWRFRNSTNSKEMRIALNSNILQFDQNTGSEVSPTWVTRFSINVDTGALTGAAVSTSAPGLAPTGDNNVAHFLDGTGNYSAPGSTSATSCRIRNSGTQSILNNTFVALTFDTEDWDVGSMHSGGSPTRITFPTAGKYLLVGQTGFSANSTGRRTLDVWINGSSIIGRGETDPNASAQTFVNVNAIVNANMNDYAELYAWQNSGSTLTTVQTASFTPQFASYKIGG